MIRLLIALECALLLIILVDGTNWIALAFIVQVTCFLALDPNTRVALYVGPVWFGILAVGYRLTKSRELAVA